MGSPRHLSAIGFWVAAISVVSSVDASGRDGIAKGVGGDPKQSIVVRLKLWRLRMGIYAAENLADRLASVQHNRSDIDQRLHLRIAGGRSGNDRAAIGVTHEHYRSVLARNTRRSAVTSSLRDVNGSCVATTLKPRRCNSVVTLFQLEPSAQAPCTSTVVTLLVCDL